MTSTPTALERLECHIEESGQIDPTVINAFRENECWNLTFFTRRQKYSQQAIHNTWALVKAAASTEVQRNMTVGRLMFFERSVHHILVPQDSNAGLQSSTSSSSVAQPSSTRMFETHSGPAHRYVVDIISFRCYHAISLRGSKRSPTWLITCRVIAVTPTVTPVT